MHDTQLYLLEPPPPHPAPDVPPPTPQTAPTTATEEGTQLPAFGEVCTAHIPVLSHIPIKIRSELADTFRTVLKQIIAADTARNQAATSTAFLKLLMFPSCLLAAPKLKCANTAQASHKVLLPFLKQRLLRWKLGLYGALWNDVKALQIPRASNPLSDVNQQKSNIRRALRLAEEGAYGKATKALTSTGVLPPSREVTQALIDKHPQTVPTIEPMYDSPARMPPPLQVDSSDVLRVVKHFAPGSAAGGSGLRPSHLQELLRVPDANPSDSLLSALTSVVNLLLDGRGPAEVAPWLSGAPLTALAKRGGGVRPIAVGETLRRLVSSCAMAGIAASAKQWFQPLQLGIATPHGTEVALHAVRRMYERYNKDADYALLSIDFKNAFNLVSRSAFLRGIRENFPSLLRWCEYCYNGCPPHLWTGNDVLRSVTGVQQGDPLGPLLFAIALHPLAKTLKRNLGSMPGEKLLLSAWYLDDGYILATHGVIREALRTLQGDATKAAGLHLNLHKCRIWWSTPPPASVTASYPSDVSQTYSEAPPS